MDFKVGDRVRCEHTWPNFCLTAGSIYIVYEIRGTPDFPFPVLLNNAGILVEVHPTNIELAPREGALTIDAGALEYEEIIAAQEIQDSLDLAKLSD